MTVFIDTGGWISTFVAGDQYHAIGVRYFQALIDLGVSTITTDFVLDEVLTRLRYDVGHPKAVEFLDRIHEADDAGILTICPITDDLWVKAEAIFLRYADARLSFTDCTSFALLREQPVDEVFGYDAHFEMMGHVLQPKA